MTFKKGFYVVGFSHDRAQRISLGIDGILEATRCKGDTFAYPADYDPRVMFKDTIGMFVGPMTNVLLRVDATCAATSCGGRSTARSARWRRTRTARSTWRSTIAGTTELESLVLSYGETMEVIGPPALRRRIGEVLRRAAARYEG